MLKNKALLILSILFLFSPVSIVFAKAKIPNGDIKGSRDNPILKRYEGSFIIAYRQKGYDEFTIPLSKLERVEGKRDSHNNRYHEPKEKRTLEGYYTRLVYLLPTGRSPLEVLRNYEDELKNYNVETLYKCKNEACGGNATRSSGGGGGDMSLSMYLFDANKITEENFSNGYCAMDSRINDQRYFVAKMPDNETYFSILTYTLKSRHSCKALNGRTIAIIDIIEDKSREKKMVTIKSKEMAKKISTSGSVALYGIYFDSNKAVVKSKSSTTLVQIAKLLDENKSLKLLVIGHTDNVGSYSYNLDLSQRRALAVVKELVTKYNINKNRLTAVGVSFASPIASNTTDEGKAKNRRVVLVEN